MARGYSGPDSGAPCVATAAEEVPDNGLDDDCDGLVDEDAWAAGDLVVTELLSAPADGGEWVEARNVSGRRVYVDGLDLVVDGVSTTLAPAAPRAVEPDGWVVFAGAGGAVILAEGEPVSTWASPVLGDDAGVPLLRIDGVPLDEIVGGAAAGPVPERGASLSLDPMYEAASANDAANRWCSVGATGDGSTPGTPGAPNPDCPGIDHDGDGWLADDGDCDDHAADVNPDAVERYDDADVDEDCNGNADDADLRPTARPTGTSTRTATATARTASPGDDATCPRGGRPSPAIATTPTPQSSPAPPKNAATGSRTTATATARTTCS